MTAPATLAEQYPEQRYRGYQIRYVPLPAHGVRVVWTIALKGRTKYKEVIRDIAPDYDQARQRARLFIDHLLERAHV